MQQRASTVPGDGTVQKVSGGMQPRIVVSHAAGRLVGPAVAWVPCGLVFGWLTNCEDEWELNRAAEKHDWLISKLR